MSLPYHLSEKSKEWLTYPLIKHIKNICISTGIDLLKIGYSNILIGFYENNFSNPKGLMEFIQKN